MFVVFVTAVPMTMLRPNAFLFGVAFVSLYLALTGWLRARHRAAAPVLTDWLTASIMALVAPVVWYWKAEFGARLQARLNVAERVLDLTILPVDSTLKNANLWPC
jgi:hypothetical protein